MVSGTLCSGEQYHNYMETQVALALPQEGHMKIYAPTQAATMQKLAVANLLNITSNKLAAIYVLHM